MEKFLLEEIRLPRRLQFALILLFFISLVLAGLLVLVHPENWQRTIYFSFLFTYLHGLSSVFTTESIRKKVTHRHTLIQIVSYGMVITLGSLVSTTIAIPLYFGLHTELPFDASIPMLYLASWYFTVFSAGVAQFFYAAKIKLMDTFQQLKEKELEEQRLREKSIRAELTALRTAVDPHFLFNALNSVATLIAVDPQKAESILIQLSDFYRYTLRFSGLQAVRFQDELQIALYYLNVQKIRFGNRLEFETNVQKELLDMQFPPMILQPLLENSIKHGIKQVIRGGKITINAFKKRDSISVIVSDNGSCEQGIQGEGFGLSGIEHRLKLLFGDRFFLKTWIDNGFHVEITIRGVNA